MKNQLTLDMRTDEGRCQVSVDLDFLTHSERVFLFSILQSAQKGAHVGFGVASSDDDQTKLLQFVLPNPIAPNLSNVVHNSLKIVN